MSASAAASSSDRTDLAFAGAAQQARLIHAGDVSAREVVEATLERIERLQPRLNAFRIVLAERALADADRIAPGDGRALAGVPVAIKDDTDVAGTHTCWGTAAAGPPARDDSPVVQRLRAAGAIVIGKTNVPELDAWGFTESVSWGATRNPWDPSRTTGGSSGGTAAAVAAGLCGVGHGTDGTGSVRNPSSWCATVGIKLTRDRIPLRPARTGWHGMTVHGPLARRVADAAAFLDATVAADGGGSFAAAAASPPRRLRVAMTLKPPPGMSTSVDDAREQAVRDTAELLRSLGHEVVERDPDLPRSTSIGIDLRYVHGVAEDAAAMARPELLEPRTRRIMRFGRALGPLVGLAERIERRAAAALDELHRDVDVLLFPGNVKPPGRIGQYAARGALYTLWSDTARVAFQPLWNLVGRPAAMLPAGFDADGLPLSVQLGARPNDEATLVALAAQLESERGWHRHRPPED